MRRASTPASESGFTLVELMVAMVVASIVVWAVLANQVRMMSAYRREDGIATVRSTLAAAKNQIATDIRMAGYLMPDGIKTVAGGSLVLVPPFAVDNDAAGDGPDSIRMLYADAARTAHVLSFGSDNQFVDVDGVGSFAVGQLAALVNPKLIADPLGGTAKIATYDACLVKITAVTASANQIAIASSGAPYNNSTNSQCADVVGATLSEAPKSETLIVGFVAKSYRIDPARRAVGALQVSPTGALAGDDYTDIGIAFVDLQVASRYVEPGDAVDVDGDGDGTLDWYSSTDQEPTGVRPAGSVASISVSFLMRTGEMTTGVVTQSTPALSQTPLAHNAIGDVEAIDLSATPMASRPEAYRGDYLYRVITTQVDARNLGGRQ